MWRLGGRAGHAAARGHWIVGGCRVKTVAIILNFIMPGVGSMVIGKVGQGITQLVLYVIGLLFSFTLIGMIIGIPLMLAAWIWAIVTAATSDPTPMQVTVIHQQGVMPSSPPATLAETKAEAPIL